MYSILYLPPTCFYFSQWLLDFNTLLYSTSTKWAYFTSMTSPSKLPSWSIPFSSMILGSSHKSYRVLLDFLVHLNLFNVHIYFQIFTSWGHSFISFLLWFLFYFIGNIELPRFFSFRFFKSQETIMIILKTQNETIWTTFKIMPS